VTGLTGFEKLRILHSLRDLDFLVEHSRGANPQLRQRLLKARTALVKIASIFPDDEFLSKNIAHLDRLLKRLPTVGTVKNTTT